MEDEEVIRKKMEDTREALTGKLESLEDRLLNSVHEATSAVTETVASVKEKVGEGVDSVKDAVDIPAHVDRHPWLMVGGAVLCGFMLGNALIRESPAPPTPPAPPRDESPPPSAAFPPPAPGQEGLLDLLEPEMRHLKGLALGTALGTLREMLTTEVPPHMAGHLREIIDGITTKLGGETLPSSDWAELRAAHARLPEDQR